MRGLIMETAQSIGLAVTERRVTPDDVRSADELFLSNSLIGLWPIRVFEDRRLPPGPLTERIQTRLDRTLDPSGDFDGN